LKALQQWNQSIGRPKARSENQVMDEGQIGVRSAARRSRETRWGLLLLAWFAGNVAVATLAWFLVSLVLK
jgi:hypothetical protein